MGQVTDEDIRHVVRERYSELATGSSGCCEPACCGQKGAADTQMLYPGTAIDEIPAEAVAASAGCGNPTALASLKPGETVVDFGSGGGIDCFLAATAVGLGGRVIGIDMTPAMVSLARKNADRLDFSNVEFYLAEMEHTPLPSNSADVIISNCVINLAPDKDAVFREAFRVLRAGGRTIVSDIVLAEALPPDTISAPNKWVACVAGAEVQSAYLERIREAGFVDVAVISEGPHPQDVERDSRGRSVDVKALKPGWSPDTPGHCAALQGK